MIKLTKILVEGVNDQKAQRTVQLTKEVLKRTQYLQFEMEKPLVREINALLNEIIVLNEQEYETDTI